MDFDTNMLKDVVRKIAPTVATALGGPLAGVAVGALSQIILGKPDGTPAELDAVVASGALTGEQILAMKKLELDYKQHEADIGVSYADLEFKTMQAELADVANARQRQIETKDRMPEIILALAFLAWVAQIAVFFFWHMPTDEYTRALVTRAYGTIDGVLLTCVAFFVGTSRGSKTAYASLTRIAEAPAAPVAAPPPTTVIQSNR